MNDKTEPPDRSWDSRTELLLKKAYLNDAFEVEAGNQRKRRRLGLGLLASGGIALAVGLTVNTAWLGFAALALLVPLFGLGFFLMAGQGVRRLKEEVEAVEVELRALESGKGRG